tara:strand:+ start:287 stop:508 length:222 start_codon:yes stop_codon:yes gene_type:complete
MTWRWRVAHTFVVDAGGRVYRIAGEGVQRRGEADEEDELDDQPARHVLDHIVDHEDQRADRRVHHQQPKDAAQ